LNQKILWLLACGAVGSHAASPVGLFEDHADVGVVLHAGSAEYDASRRSYTVSGSGENLWAAADGFHFVWQGGDR
jgi:uncharacterized protein YbjT (DUF2867 family)